jgi:protein-tyrosine phosphatase
MKAKLYWVNSPWTGRLAIMSRPRGGDWLEDGSSAGIDVVVSTLTKDEIAELDLKNEEALCRANGMEYIAFPIVDRGVPMSFQATVEMLQHSEKKLAAGRSVAIHCRQGIGRSALLAACLLVLAGADPDTAIQRVGASRGCPVPETAAQREWVARFSRDSLAESQKG